MGQVKQSLIDTPDENWVEMLNNDEGYHNFLSRLENDSEFKRFEEALPEEQDSLESGRDEQG